MNYRLKAQQLDYHGVPMCVHPIGAEPADPAPAPRGQSGKKRKQRQKNKLARAARKRNR